MPKQPYDDEVYDEDDFLEEEELEEEGELDFESRRWGEIEDEDDEDW
jgi:hypothetical protein